MDNNSEKITRNQKTIGFLALITMLSICGCGGFFDEKATELQSRDILRDLSEIEPELNKDITVPEIYKTPPQVAEQIVDGQKEYNLFYFCKYHTSEKLLKLIHSQFAVTLFDKKGKSTVVPTYTVSSNPATNQLIVRCPKIEDVEAIIDFLEFVDVAPVQVKIDCLISEVYADVTMDWETTILIQNLFGERISLGGKVTETGTLLPAFPGAALRDAARATFGLKTGYVRNEGIAGREFRALVDLLVSRGYLKILMNPSLEVVNGETAEIITTEKVPLDIITHVHPISGILTTSTQYEDVIDSLKITPHVFADGYIGLETTAVIGSKATPEGVKQVPIVTSRQIKNKENRIRRGESLLIGGITKTEKRSVVRGVPFLKDIPLLGILFSSKDFEERGKEVLFIITPTISTGGIPNKEMVEQLRRKHEQPAVTEALQALQKTIMDPFGLETRQREYEMKTQQLDKARLEAEREKAKARISIREAYERAKRERAASEKATTEAEKIMAEAEKIKAEAEKAKAEAEKAKAEAEKAKAEAQQQKYGTKP